MERNKYRLNKSSSQIDVNEDITTKVNLSSDSKLLPYNEIARIISENKQFNKERQDSGRYRMVVTLNGLFSNPLFNITGENSWSSFNEPLFRDRSYPPNGVSLNEEEDYGFLDSIENHLTEKNGWFGYYSPKINEVDNHRFTHMEPGLENFQFVNKEKDNWDFTLTYPASSYSNELTDGGLNITSSRGVIVGGKEMTAIAVPYKHNLKLDDEIRLKNTNHDGVYSIKRVGLDNGDYKDNFFVIDINVSRLDISTESRFARLSSNKECSYYFRVHKRLKTIEGNELSKNDYDLSTLAFSKNLFGDSMTQFATKTDIDVNGLTDNLGRPLSELNLMLIKKTNKGFTNIQSGLYVNDVEGVSSFKNIPDIRRIHNGIDSHDHLQEDVKFGDDEYFGDLVEYDENNITETVLAEVHHRFNTINRIQEESINTVLRNEEEDTILMPNVGDLDSWHGTNPFDGPTIVDTTIILFSSFQRGNGGLEINPENNNRTLIDFRVDEEKAGGKEPGQFTFNSYFLGYSLEDSEGCNLKPAKSYYLAGRSFEVATKIFVDKYGMTEAPTGVYSNGTVYRHWNRTSGILGPLQQCDKPNTEPPKNNENRNGFNLGPRQEGYFYKPFHKIKIREFSNYIETGDNKTYGIPEYAVKLTNGRYIWRDLMDIGVNDVNQNFLDYPFLNGAHYVYSDHIIAIKRQDPFGDYNLRFDGIAGDIVGKRISDNHKINRVGDVC